MDQRPPEQKRNGYSDEDLAQINERLDAAEAKRDEAIQNAKDTYKREVKVIEAEAKQVKVPVGALRSARKVRVLQGKLKSEVAKVKADEIEVFEDMLGQMTFLRPEPGETVDAAAARQAVGDAGAHHEAEQAEGAAVLDELTAAH